MRRMIIKKLLPFDVTIEKRSFDLMNTCFVLHIRLFLTSGTILKVVRDLELIFKIIPFLFQWEIFELFKEL